MHSITTATEINRTRRVSMILVAILVALVSLTFSSPQSASAETLVAKKAGTATTSTTFMNYGYSAWRFYIKPGEKLNATFTQKYLQTNKAWAFQRDFTLYGPNGTTGITKTIARNAANGTSVNFSYTATVANAGVWEIRAEEEDSALDNYGNPSYSAGAAHHNRQAFDIKVTTSGGTEIPGRTWGDGQHNIGQPSQAQNSPAGGNFDTSDFSVYYLSDEGWLYKTDYYDYNGMYSRLQATNVGILTKYGPNAGQPAYKSVQATETYKASEGETPSASTPYLNIYQNDPLIKRFKVFYSDPANDLPATATLYDGTTIVVSNEAAPLVPPVSGFSLTRAADGTGTVACTQTNVQSESNIDIDTNNDGDYTDNVDVHLEQALGAGAVSYSWDGKDGLGNDVPAFRRVKVKVSVNRTAEIHFGSDDLEHRGGVKNYLMNAPAGTSAADRYKIYWDDTDLSDNDPLGNPLMVTATKDGTAGVNSNVTGGIHPLPGSNNNDGWGNNRVIDEWAYVPTDAEASAIGEGVDSLNIDKSASVRGGGVAKAGSTIDYTITVQNIGPDDFTVADPATVVDEMTRALDDAVYNNDAVANPAGTLTYASPRLTWSGPLASGATLTITYSMTANNPFSGNKAVFNAAASMENPSDTPAPGPFTCANVVPSTVHCDASSVPLAGLTIVKTSNQDVGSNPPASLPNGTSVNWSYTVTNTGATVLTGLGVVDDKGVTVTCPSTTLAVGAQMVCTGTGTVHP